MVDWMGSSRYFVAALNVFRTLKTALIVTLGAIALSDSLAERCLFRRKHSLCEGVAAERNDESKNEQRLDHRSSRANGARLTHRWRRPATAAMMYCLPLCAQGHWRSVCRRW